METTKQQFTLTRTFQAPKQLVFEAFTTREALAQWWGPVEAPIDVIALDFKVNGIFHYQMKGEQMNYGIMRFKEIDAPHSITWINSFANERGEAIKPPFEGLDFPKEVLNKIVLTEQDGITTLLLTSEPLNASFNETETFYSITQSMQQGYGGTFNQLENYLKQRQKR